MSKWMPSGHQSVPPIYRHASTIGHVDVPPVTIAIIPRETYSRTLECVASLTVTVRPDIPVIFVDAAYPRSVLADVRTLLETWGGEVTYLRTSRIVSPNHARNLCLPHVTTRYVLFVDNDVVGASGWLEEMLACAEHSQAALVTPLTCQGEPVHTEVHCAGGLAHLSDGPQQSRRLIEVQFDQGRSRSELEGREREVTELAEFHCLLIRMDIFLKVGPLDEQLRCTREHIDFCLLVRNAGQQIVFEPGAVVTYLASDHLAPMDRWFYAVRWCDFYWWSSLRHFARKWGVKGDPSFQKRYWRCGLRRYQHLVAPWLERWIAPSRGKAFRAIQLLAMASESVVNGVLVGSHLGINTIKPYYVTIEHQPRRADSQGAA